MTTLLPAKIFDCYYGQPGTGKSEVSARLIEQLYRETGKTSRVVLGDGSMLSYQHLIDAKIVEVVEYSWRPWPFDTLMKLASGYWPADASDPTAPLLPPTEATLQVGGYVFEGLSVAANYIMGNIKGGMAWRSGQGEKMGQESPIRIVEADLDPKTGLPIPNSGPGTKFGGNPPAHYNMVQRNIVGLIQQSRGLPGRLVIWTAHEAINDPEKDALVKEQLIGPEVAGKALTGNIQRFFTNTLHLQTVAKRVKVDDSFTGRKVDELDLEYRLYTRDHFNANGSIMTRYKACTRTIGPEFPQFFTSSEPGKAILDYYEAVAASWKQKLAAVTTSTTERDTQ
jgi:hypothetical protein